MWLQRCSRVRIRPFARFLSGSGIPSSGGSPFPPLAISDANLTDYVTEGFAGFAEAAPAHTPALLDGITGDARSWADLLHDVSSVGAALGAGVGGAVGLGAGDVLALVSPNHVDYFSCLHAALRLGAAVNPVNPVLTAAELESMLRACRAKVVVAHPQCLAPVLAALASDGRSRSAARHAARGGLHGGTHGHGSDAAAIAEAQAEGTRRSSRERRTTMDVKREAEERERAAREEDLKKRKEAAAAAKEVEAAAAKEAADAVGLASEHAGLGAKGHMAGGLLFGGIHGHGKKLTASAVAREIQHDTYLNPLRESAAKIAAGSSRRNTGPCTSRFRGVTQQPNGKWRAQIYRYGSMDSLGSFDSEVEAAVAYDTAARMYRGAGALCNFPDGVPGEDNVHVS